MKTKKKKTYVKPNLEVIKITKDEIITTSGGNNFGGDYLNGIGYKI